MQVSVEKALGLLRQGEVVAVPTDTVYGIAADMFNEQAIIKLYSQKGRQRNKPMVIQLACVNEIHPFLSHIPFDLDKLLQRFWPGELTVVLPVKKDQVPAIVRAHLPTAAFRVSKNTVTRSLIDHFGPLVITSANASGMQDLLSPSEIEQVFGAQFPILVDENLSASGKPSMILAYIDASWVIVRKGDITLKELSQVLGYHPPVVRELNFDKKEYTISPQLHLMERPYDGSIKVVLGFSDRKYMQAEHIITLGALSKPLEIKKTILKAMQEINQEKYPHVWVDVNFPKEGPLKELLHILERATKVEG